MVCLESRLTKSIWVNSFTVFKTFEKWDCNFKSREATVIAFIFRDSYKKIETTSESIYILKRLSNHLNKLVKYQKRLVFISKLFSHFFNFQTVGDKTNVTLLQSPYPLIQCWMTQCETGFSTKEPTMATLQQWIGKKGGKWKYKGRFLGVTLVQIWTRSFANQNANSWTRYSWLTKLLRTFLQK